MWPKIGGGQFEPFQVWFDEVSFTALGGAPPVGVSVTAEQVSEKRKSTVQIAVTDSLGNPVNDGTVVVLQADKGRLPAWVTTRNGRAEFVYEVDQDMRGEYQVWARCGNAVAKIRIGDVLAGRVVGRVFNADDQSALAAVISIQDSLGHEVLRRAADGIFQVHVPPGVWWITADAGPTYTAPERQAVEVVAGDSVIVQLPVQNWVDLRARGWLAGDMNVRGASGKMMHPVLVSDVVLEARAAGLDWALLTDYWDTTLRHYRPQDMALWQKDFYGLWGRFFQTSLGDVWTLGDAAQDANSMFEARALTHQDRGIVGYTKVFTPSQQASGVVFDVLAGPTFDCLDVMPEYTNDAFTQKLWFELLNRGYRIAGTASSGAVLDDVTGSNLGRFRTYVRLDGDVTPGRMSQALAQGNSFMSNGPLMLFSVFAAGPGSVLPAGRKRRATIRAWSQGQLGDFLTGIELIRNGEVIESWSLDTQPRMHKLSVALEDSVDCWYVAKCYGTDSTQVALTNPIFFETSNFSPPEPLQAVVHGEIKAEGKTISEAQVLVKNALGQVVLETTARNGQFRLWAPPTGIIEVNVSGYAPIQQRIIDDPQLTDWLRQMSQVSSAPDTLYAENSFDRVAEILNNIDMLFVLDVP